MWLHGFCVMPPQAESERADAARYVRRRLSGQPDAGDVLAALALDNVPA